MALGHYQIEAQERFAKQLAERTEASTKACAEVVANEISTQTIELRESIERVGAQLSDDIAQAAHEVSSVVSAAVYEVGARLAMNLAEMEWQLAQQNEALDRILHVLQESRSNEARQLISQGVRLYNAGAFDRAEERFRRALDYDATDYQVLMNLGFIEIHNEHPDAARKFFKDALTLPGELDASAKARAFRAMATLEGALANYSEAIRLGDHALALGEKDASLLYLTAMWSASAGDKREALRRVREAILMDPRYFSKAAIEPAFSAMHDETVELLMALASSAQAAAEELQSQMQDVLERIQRNDHREEYAELTRRLGELLSRAKGLFLAKSYSGYRRYCTEIQRVGDLPRRVLDLIAQVDRNRQENDGLQKDAERIERETSNDPAANSCAIGCGVMLLTVILALIFQHVQFFQEFLLVIALSGLPLLMWYAFTRDKRSKLDTEKSLNQSKADANQEEYSKLLMLLAQLSEALSPVETRENPDTPKSTTMDAQI